MAVGRDGVFGGYAEKSLVLLCSSEPQALTEHTGLVYFHPSLGDMGGEALWVSISILVTCSVREK